MDRFLDVGAPADVKTPWDFRDKTKGQERVLCLDEATGKILWKHAYPCAFANRYLYVRNDHEILCVCLAAHRGH